MNKINILNLSRQSAWKAPETKFHETVNILEINQQGHIFAGTKNGLFISDDNGKSWDHLGLAGVYISSIAVDSKGNLFAGCHKQGVYRSTDNGQNWFQMNMGFGDPDINSIIINAKDEIFLGTESGVFISENNGIDWKEANQGLIYPFIDAMTVNSSGIFAGTDDGIFITDFHNENWSQTNLRNTFIISLVSNANEVYAGTREGIFNSRDNGATWHNIGLEDKEILAMALTAGYLLAGTDTGFFYTSNNGKTWLEIYEGLTNPDVLTIVISLRGDIFIGTGSGVFYLSE